MHIDSQPAHLLSDSEGWRWATRGACRAASAISSANHWGVSVLVLECGGRSRRTTDAGIRRRRHEESQLAAASSSLVSSDFAFQRIKFLAGENGRRQGPGSWNCRRQNCGSQNCVKNGKNKQVHLAQNRQGTWPRGAHQLNAFLRFSRRSQPRERSRVTPPVAGITPPSTP